MPTDRSLDATVFRHRPSWAGRWVLITYVAVLVYASLYPFAGWRIADAGAPLAWSKYISAFDVGLNLVAYGPLGALIAARARRHGKPLRIAWAQAVLLSFALSFVLECLQTLLPARVSSMLDLAVNTFGALVGASVVLSAPGRSVLTVFEQWRRRHFAPTAEAEWGLLLLGLWLFAQLNPAIPFFEAGTFANPLTAATERSHPYDPLLLMPQAIGIALNVAGFALFTSLLFHARVRTSVNVVLILMFGFVAKISMASLMLKAPQLIAWLSPATVIGLAGGIALFLLLRSWRHRWRAFAATLFVFAGGLLSKMNSVYGAFDEMLRLFDWPYGHLVNFASLTRWANEVWPVAASIFLAVVFLTDRNRTKMTSLSSAKISS
jgi:VanZ family protein